MSKKAFLGVDVSAATLDFALLFASNPNSFVDLQTKNNSSGFLQLANWLNKQGVALDDCLIVMEYTGVYTLDFLVFLDSLGVQACSCSPIDIKRSIGLQRGKADKVDARRIATYALTQSYRLKTRALPEKALMELKEAVTMRRLYVKQKAALKNALHAHKKYHVYTGSDSHVTMLLQDIEHLNRRIKEIEKWIAAIIKKNEELNQNFKLIESVPGVGMIVAAMFLVYTNNFQYFDDARKFMCYAGVAPFPNESGTMKKQARVSHLANKKMKSYIMNGVTSAIEHNQEIKAYYNRKLKQGKSKACARNAVAAKVISYTFAVIKRQTPFVKIYSDNFLPKAVA